MAKGALVRQWKKSLYFTFFFSCLTIITVKAQTPQPQVTSIEIAQVDNSSYPNVTVYLRVLNAKGDRVGGISKEDFSVYEDGKFVEIINFISYNAESIHTILVIDKSTSMDYEDKLAQAKSAANIFVDLMRAQDETALIAFDNSVYTLNYFTSEKVQLESSIDSLISGDCTSWYDAVYQAAAMAQNTSGRKSIILISDGIDCSENQLKYFGYGSTHTLDEAITLAQQVEVPVSVVALGVSPSTDVAPEGYDEGRLMKTASETGGSYYHLPTADQLAELYRSISKQTQEEYVITYRSPRPDYDGTRRNLQIEISVGGVDTTPISGQGSYLENHLVNIKSNPLLATLIFLPLLFAFLLPLPFLNVKVKIGKEAPIGVDKDSVDKVYTPQFIENQPRENAAGIGIRKCPHCGHSSRPGALFCPFCGRKISTHSSALQPTICPNCGSFIRSQARFCGHCGYRL